MNSFAGISVSSSVPINCLCFRNICALIFSRIFRCHKLFRQSSIPLTAFFPVLSLCSCHGRIKDTLYKHIKELPKILSGLLHIMFYWYVFDSQVSSKAHLNKTYISGFVLGLLRKIEKNEYDGKIL